MPDNFGLEFLPQLFPPRTRGTCLPSVHHRDTAAMAPSSTALTTKPQSGSPYQLDSAQALRAAKALSAHIKSAESTKAAQSTKKNLLEDESSDEEASTDGQIPVWLVVTAKKHVVDKKRLKPAKIALPHPLSLPAQRICLM